MSSLNSKIRQIGWVYRLVHYVLTGLLVALILIAYTNQKLVTLVYETLDPVTTSLTKVLFLSELYGQTAQNPYETTAYITLLCFGIAAVYINFFLALRREFRAIPAINGDVQLNLSEYLCRYFYSQLSPMVSPHFILRKSTPPVPAPVQLRYGMSHREVIRELFTSRKHAEAVVEGYAVTVLILSCAQILYWLDNDPQWFGPMPHYSAVTLLAYCNMYLLFEGILLFIAYFFSRGHRGEKRVFL